MPSVIAAALGLISRLDLTIVVKATIVMALGLVAQPLASRARAAVRHLLMAATFGTVLVLPLVISAVPPVTVHVPLAVAERVSVISNEASAPLIAASGAAMRAETNDRAVPSVATFVRSVWAMGAILLLVVLAVDLGRLRSLRRGALPWPTQNDLIRSLAATSDVGRSVDVLLHENVSAPLTYGLWRPVILLPIDASDWREADLRRALVHELEHVRRGDWATQLLAQVVCACYWFHPLVWLAWGRFRLEAERACDDAVVQSTECTEYADQLVSLARRMSTSRAFPSLAMANRTDLSARVTALLDGTRSRGRAGNATTASVVGVASLVVLLVTSVRAIAAPISAPQATHVEEPARESAVAPRQPDRGTRAQGTAGRQRTPADPKNSTRHRAKVQMGERASYSRDSIGDAQAISALINRSINGGSASAERTVIHSSTASGTATHSASASSSSN